MNEYISDRMAREHADRLLTEAAAVRRSRLVRRSRRHAAAAPAGRPASRPRRPAVVGAAARSITRPFAAVGSWLAAGQL